MSAQKGERFVLELYVTGHTRYSERAVVNVRRVCEEYLPGRYDLAIHDLLKHPNLAAGALIVAAPTLVKRLPLPERRLIGDMSRTDRLVAGLGLDLLPTPATDTPSH